jgi:hypothetical protein
VLTNSGKQVSGKDRRRAPRVAADLPIELVARDAGAPARLRDISSNGLCCTSAEAIPELTMVRVQLDLEGQRHALEGVVVRCERAAGVQNGWDVAVFFQELPRPVRQGLESFLTRRLNAVAR